MRLTKAATEDRYNQIQELYMRAFPASERKPFSLIRKKLAEGSMEVLSIEDDNGDFKGLAIYVLDEDLALLDYLAILEEHRNKGVGSEALAKLKQYYPDKRFLLEIEDAEEDVEDRAIRIRRKGFYLRNGMTVMPFLVDLFTVKMEVLTDEAEVTYEEYFGLYSRVFGPGVSKHVKLIRGKED